MRRCLVGSSENHAAMEGKANLQEFSKDYLCFIVWYRRVGQLHDGGLGNGVLLTKCSAKLTFVC